MLCNGMLKSDHFGIEILYTSSVSNNVKRLKSDHFGIEIYDLCPWWWFRPMVKIRPFWD